MKHVLIPTDFSVRSLNLIRYALNHFEGERLKITLLHLLDLPTGITDLLFLGRDHRHLQLLNTDYKDGIQVLLNSQPTAIESIHTEFLFVGSQLVFNNFIESQKIDVIIYPDQYELRMPAANSVHPARYIKRSKVPVLSVKIARSRQAVPQNSLAELMLPLADVTT
ncbi:MAG TPA: universal stress protein [Phnomibacter sp.]|nr:universal stress protein [Phnomibacter sp.]